MRQEEGSRAWEKKVTRECKVGGEKSRERCPGFFRHQSLVLAIHPCKGGSVDDAALFKAKSRELLLKVYNVTRPSQCLCLFVSSEPDFEERGANGFVFPKISLYESNDWHKIEPCNRNPAEMRWDV